MLHDYCVPYVDIYVHIYVYCLMKGSRDQLVHSTASCLVWAARPHLLTFLSLFYLFISFFSVWNVQKYNVLIIRGILNLVRTYYCLTPKKIFLLFQENIFFFCGLDSDTLFLSKKTTSFLLIKFFCRHF